MSNLPIFAEFAEVLADAARAEVLRWRKENWNIENKSKGGPFDPVTRVDRAIEQVMRKLIQERWSDHGIVGEEFGALPGAGCYSWSLDPIDGTRSFICGLPTWTILIALLQQGRPVLGLIDAPQLGERFRGYDEVGELITLSGIAPLRTSGCRTLNEARLSTTDPFLFPHHERDAFDRIREKVQLTRYGLDAYSYARLAAGGLDIVIESGLAAHDLNALVPVVIASGGAVSNWSGEFDFSEGKIVAAATEDLLREAVALL